MSEPTDIEYQVIATFNQIAKSFDTTRNHIWPKNKAWFDKLSTDDKDSKIIDVGCGNGRNMMYLIKNECSHVEGCDVSDEFVSICTSKSLKVQQENILHLSYADNTFDNVICVAVIHHLSTVEHRLQAIRELTRIVKPGGTILIQVWAFEQKYSKTVYCEKDVMIGWNMKRYNFDSDIILNRYYHLFEDHELDELCAKCDVDIKELYLEHDNYGIILIKK